MYCRNCGQKLKSEDKFCAGCGNSVGPEIGSSQNVVVSELVIQESDKKNIYLFLYPIIFINNVLTSYDDGKFDEVSYIVNAFIAILEIAVTHFIIFNRFGRNKNTSWLTALIFFYILVCILLVAVSFFGFNFSEADAVRLSSGLDFASFTLFVIQIGYLIFLRRKFINT